MALISKKKIIYPISVKLRDYLGKYRRMLAAPTGYEALLRFDNAISLYDSQGVDTLWETVFYPQSEMKAIHHDLKQTYSELKADGDVSVMGHLYVDRVDICQYGNTKPFRVRIVNQINDNFDYFYIKNADASRVYGLELEHLLSPNRINYRVYRHTLIEEHIAGIPGDQFIKTYLKGEGLSEIRLAKEFIKFNERCFVRLLGDMHSSNFVVNIIPDFEETTYCLKAIDFDQQSYEGRKNVYLPQYFKQNNALIQMGMKYMEQKTIQQYQREERALIAHRLSVAKHRVFDLLNAMAQDTLSLPEHVQSLKQELADFYHEPKFLTCQSMGELVKLSLWFVLQKAEVYRTY